ncbi:ABC transporter substrate-binding protein [Planobispora rosea]|uniref:ABC transporter substrate-binding protein n=1 Tax=Planobispora rosea TaxID=35762 RepID=A0A8J3WCD5_PLARO|nr:ABC transporter substrate-binding protein [Planobispora rosea]GGS59888.1 ABC transporter substrate-binding protein [Planobispora rosea]GIH84095.1 ABC transporter substrate-binding protein [Planobispora rosea]
MSPRTRLGAAFVLALTVTGCAAPAETVPSSGPSSGGSPAQQVVTVTSCGQELSFQRPPSRAVTLEQSSTELLLALGLQDRMAGTSNLKTEIPPRYRAAYERIPVLNPKIITSEQLRAATPDLAVSPFASLFTKDRAGTREELHRAGLPTYVSAVDCPDLAENGLTPFDLLFQDYENLGRIFRAEERAAALIAEQRAAVEAAAASRKEATGRPSILWLYSMFNGVPYVAGDGGMPSAMSELLGAENAFDDVDELWPEVSWEEVARRDPDVIVIGDLSERGRPGDSAEEKIAMMRENPLAAELTAVRENRLIEVPGIEMDPSVRTVDTLRLVADGLRRLGRVR